MTPPTPSPQPAENQPVRLAKSMLTGQVYATRYDADVPDGEHPRVIEKYDVTADYRAMADAEHAARQLLNDPIGQAAGRRPGEQLDDTEEARLRDVIRAATDSGVHSETVDAPVEPADESGADA